MSDRKVIVVTGASSGIGRALALEAARAGYAVLAVSRDKTELDQVAAEINAAGGSCTALTIDVTQPDAPERIVQTARASFGRMDVLVHCAGAAVGGMLFDQSDEQLDGQWHLHVAAPLRITRAAFPLLQSAGGQVMFVGSGLRRVPAPYYGAYCAAKAAVETLATQLRRELLGTGVAVTFIDPGSVRTNFAKNAGIPAYGPEWVPVKPELVAKRIVRAIDRRPSRLLAVPWHTLGAILGEWFPHFADKSVTPPGAKLSRPEVSSHPEVSKDPEESKGPQTPTPFDLALQPVARRLERVKLPPEFLADLLRPGSDVHLADAAMRWAGMPNKNERAAMEDALEALAAGGFLERTGDESWRVLRSARGGDA